jgi:hypothetical protein
MVVGNEPNGHPAVAETDMVYVATSPSRKYERGTMEASRLIAHHLRLL